MLSPPDRAEAARRWLRWADEDLEIARHTAAVPDLVARGACVWAHQAAEKALKALLVFHDVDPPKLRDLDRLVQRLPVGERSGFMALELPQLTRWSIEGRYPADLDEATTDDATSAVAIATDVIDLVRQSVEV